MTIELKEVRVSAGQSVQQKLDDLAGAINRIVKYLREKEAEQKKEGG